MTDQPTTIEEFIDAYGDFRDGLRVDAPTTARLSAEDRAVVEGWVEHLQVFAGVDSLLSLPSADALLARADVVRREWSRQDLADELLLELRATVWPGTHVAVNDHESPDEIPWDVLVNVKGVPLRILLDMGARTAAEALGRRLADVAMIFGAFPAESTVVLAAAGDEVIEAAVVDRAHVTAAFETPTGVRVPPRLAGGVDSPARTCRRFFEETIIEFGEGPTPVATTVPELEDLVEPEVLVGESMRLVAEAARRARIPEKSAGYGALRGPQQAALAALLRRAIDGRLDDISDELAKVGEAA